MADKAIGAIAKLVEILNSPILLKSMAIIWVASLLILRVPGHLWALVNIQIGPELISMATPAFIISSSALVVECLFFFHKKTTRIFERRSGRKHLNKVVDSLTEEEIAYLMQFFSPRRVEIVYFDSDDIVVKCLVDKGILTYIERWRHRECPFKLSERFKELITKKISIIV